MYAAMVLMLLCAAGLFSHAIAERMHHIGRFGQGSLVDSAMEEADEEWLGKGPCSEKFVTGVSQMILWQMHNSCPRSWVSRGRCNVINGACVPNCASESNQNKDLCEASFCQWLPQLDLSKSVTTDGRRGVCTFSEANATLRRAFCQRQESELGQEQADFCTGIRTGYQIKLEAEHEPCSVKDVSGFDRWSSCPEAWQSSGRCNVINGTCVPNCASERNQNETLCEASFCQWLPHFEDDKGREGVCTFNEANTTLRRDFCRSQEKELVKEQADFCAGMRTGPPRKSEAERLEPVHTILREMTRCWRPDPKNRSSYDDMDVQSAMVRELNTSFESFRQVKKSGGEFQFYPVTTMNPLQMFGPIRDQMPYHYAVMTTHPDHKKYMDSYCLSHDYDTCSDADTLKADPHGCCLFKQSFLRLKDTSTCVKQKLEKDPYRWIWTRFSEVAEQDEPNTWFERGVVAAELKNEIRNKFGDSVYATDLVPSTIHEQLSLWRECKGRVAHGKCQRNHIWERMVELIQAIEKSDKDWSSLTTSKDIKDLIFKSLEVTFTIPERSQYTRIHNDTLDSIAEECFRLPVNLSQPVPEETLMIREATACFPLTWDAVEIPGQPKQALWQTDWKPAVETEYKTVPPICGRMALAGLTRQMTRTTYPWHFELLYQTSWADVNDDYCLHPSKAQCKNFKQCWQRWMTNHVRMVHPMCEAATTFDKADEVEQEQARDSFTCCCRTAEKITEIDYDGDCDTVKHLDRNILGDRYFNTTTKSCCKWVDSAFGCTFQLRYSEGDKDQCRGR